MTKMSYENDHLRNRDKRALAKLAGQEGREVLTSEKISEDLTMVCTRVTSEIWNYHGDKDFPNGIIFNVRGIKDGIVSGKMSAHVIKIDLTEEIYRHSLENGGVEEAHVARLTPEDLEKIAVAVLMHDNALMLIDGHHRLVRRYREGLVDLRVVVVHWKECRGCVIYPSEKILAHDARTDPITREEVGASMPSDLERVTVLVRKYHDLRADHHFLLADQIRDELIGQGVTIRVDGTWEPTSWRALARQSVFGGDFLLDLRGCLAGTAREVLAPALSNEVEKKHDHS